jgi:hypothetical protein
VAAVAGHQHSAGLAVAWAVHRRSDENDTLEEISISQGRAGRCIGLEEAQRVEALRTSSNLFQLLGARTARGRLLRPDDDKPGQPPVVI